MTIINIRVSSAPFNVGEEYHRLIQTTQDAGAVALFVGRVRGYERGINAEYDTNKAQQPLQTLTLEHYPAMTQKAIRAMADDASSKWKLLAINIIHRVGTLQPDEEIVLVAVASAHRADAFAACEMLMDYLKTKAPFWKQATQVDGTQIINHWVEAKAEDEERLSRWQ